MFISGEKFGFFMLDWRETDLGGWFESPLGPFCVYSRFYQAKGFRQDKEMFFNCLIIFFKRNFK